MNLLAIDTAAEKLSVALAAGDNTWLFEADAGLRHSELLMDCVDLLMNKAALKPEELSGIVCMGGPGSFTGLRIGFAAAKGLALALGIPFFPISTLDCLARPFAAWPGIIVPVLDAKQKAFFCALFRGGKRLSPDMDADPSSIAAAIDTAIAEAASNGPPEQALLAGPGAALLYEKITGIIAGGNNAIRLGRDLPWGNAATLLKMAKETCVMTHNVDYNSGPQYIRKSDAELKLS